MSKNDKKGAHVVADKKPTASTAVAEKEPITAPIVEETKDVVTEAPTPEVSPETVTEASTEPEMSEAPKEIDGMPVTTIISPDRLKELTKLQAELRLEKKQIREGLKAQKKDEHDALPPVERASRKALNSTSRCYRALKKGHYQDAYKLASNLRLEIEAAIKAAEDLTKIQATEVTQ